MNYKLYMIVVPENSGIGFLRKDRGIHAVQFRSETDHQKCLEAIGDKYGPFILVNVTPITSYGSLEVKE